MYEAANVKALTSSAANQAFPLERRWGRLVGTGAYRASVDATFPARRALGLLEFAGNWVR